ncbi:hypothetical protein ACJIZ3_006359 [Penstemon smallii]|uniref:Uncharacterized protein n=1 Tax=Penstemon smallii TaxID=265156 RepID=A0ABD3S7M3_9LAMI
MKIHNKFFLVLQDNKDNPRGGIVREKTPLQPKAVKIKTEPASYGSSTSSNSKGSKSGSASDGSK